MAVDAVALLDGKTGDRKIGAVPSPTSVMSVPCSVVTTANCGGGGVAASICLASIALTECGMA